MKKLFLFGAACALFVIGCGDKSGGEDTAATTGTTGASTTTTGSTAQGATAAGTTGGTTASTADNSAGAGGGFATLQPVLSKCTGCHGATNPKGGINLTTQESVMKGGKEGPIVTAGDPDNSVIIQALQGTHGKRQMPPAGKLPDDQIKIVSDWIKAGAKA